MVVRNNSFNTSFQGKPAQRVDRKKLVQLRRADNQRDGEQCTGMHHRAVDHNTPITLPRVKFLEKPDEP